MRQSPMLAPTEGGHLAGAKDREARKLLLHVFPSFAAGGSEIRFVALVNALDRRYRHTLLAMNGHYEAAEGLDKDVDIAFAAMPVVKTSTISLANLRNERRLLRRLRPDLLLTHNWGSIEWALANWRSSFCPHIHIEHGFGPDKSPYRQHKRRVIARRLLLSRCAQIVVPSRVLVDVATRVWRLPADRVTYLPNGIDCERFARPPDAALLAKHGIADDGPLIGTVAILRPEKNLAATAGLRLSAGGAGSSAGDRRGRAGACAAE